MQPENETLTLFRTSKRAIGRGFRVACLATRVCRWSHGSTNDFRRRRSRSASEFVSTSFANYFFKLSPPTACTQPTMPPPHMKMTQISVTRCHFSLLYPPSGLVSSPRWLASSSIFCFRRVRREYHGRTCTFPSRQTRREALLSGRMNS